MFLKYSAVVLIFISALNAFALESFLIPIVKEPQLERIPWAREVYVQRFEDVGPVTAVAAGKQGGKYAVAAGMRSCVSVWDVETLRPLWALEGEQIGGGVNFLRFGVGDDASLYAATGVPGISGFVLKISKGKVEKLAEAKDSFYALAISPDGKFLCAGAFDGTMILYDIEKKKILWKENRAPRRLTAVAFSSDSQKMLAGFADSSIELCEKADLFKSAKKIFSAGGVVRGVAFAPKDAGVISAAYDDMQECFVSESFEEGLRRMTALRDRKPQALAFDPVSFRILVAGGGGSMMSYHLRGANRPFWDSLELELREGESTQNMDCGAYKTWLWSVDVINENCYVAGGDDGRIFIWRRDGWTPTAFICILSSDAKKWASLVKEVYCDSSDPKIFSWKMHNDRAPEADKEKAFRDASMIPIFMKSALTFEKPTKPTVWPPKKEEKKAEAPKKAETKKEAVKKTETKKEDAKKSAAQKKSEPVAESKKESQKP